MWQNKFILNTLFSLLIFLNFQFFIFPPICSPSFWQIFCYRIMPNYTLCLLVIPLDSFHSSAPWDKQSFTGSFSLACCFLVIPSVSCFSSPGTSKKPESDWTKTKQVTVSRAIILPCSLVIHRIIWEFMLLPSHLLCLGETIY